MAIRMVRDQAEMLQDIQREAEALGYHQNLEVYTDPAKIRSGTYHWLGHSLGCKYITLLQRLTDLNILIRNNRDETKDILTLIDEYVKDRRQAQDIIQALKEIGPENLSKLSLENQPGILMAPIITGIEGAIPVKFVANIVKKFLDARPSETETKEVIEDSMQLEQTDSSFSRFMGLIGFKSDQVQAKAKTLDWLLQLLKRYSRLTDDIISQDDQRLGKGHLAPLNIVSRNEALADYLVDTVLPHLEAKVKGLESPVQSIIEAQLLSVPGS